MISYRLSDEAFEDLSEIWHYIAFDSRAAADRFEQAIFDACESIASLPFVGVVRTDLTRSPGAISPSSPLSHALDHLQPRIEAHQDRSHPPHQR
jgi:plasmid stabilization system protein ParE